MALSPGSRLGPYEILALLGAGGMGEVYKARDTRLERTVAIKVLPDQLLKNEEVRRRFEREAKMISQLSHPHICALHDVGSQDGVEYLVMDYLEGETLADRLSQGPLRLEQTLRYGIEIAGALDQAHRQGIVHRDLKPGNVMLTKSGVKLLDFGLAKVIDPEGPATSFTSAPTAAKDVTREGAILGTETRPVAAGSHYRLARLPSGRAPLSLRRPGRDGEADLRPSGESRRRKHGAPREELFARAVRPGRLRGRVRLSAVRPGREPARAALR